MKEEKVAVKSSTAKENEPVLENGKKKVKEERPATKVVVRCLPPTMTEDEFKMQIAPIPDYDYFYYVTAEKSLTPNAFSRAYLNFLDQTDLFIFTQKFDGYVFLDSKGGEFPAVVEFAPFQRIPKNRPNRKKDPKVGTIDADPLFVTFKERLEAESLENRTALNASKQHFFETSLVPEEKEESNTPLLDYIKNRRAERQKIRDEKREEKKKKDLERKKTKEEQKRTKKEDDTSVIKVLNNQNTSKERMKEKEAKQGAVKKKSEEVKSTVKEKSTSESKSKESKTRTGKSYLEERQRQAERREEQRKKLTKSQSSSLLDSKLQPTSDDKTDLKEEKLTEERTTGSESKDSKSKESEFKKPERVFKREEIKKSSYKHEGKRERETDEARKTRKTNNERNHQSSKKDDDKSEDVGRKRYSESRRSHDSTHRERYKDKEKNKSYGQKKTSGSTTDPDKVKHFTEQQNKPPCSNEIDENSEKAECLIKELNELPESDQVNDPNGDGVTKQINVEEIELALDQRAKSKIFQSKDKTKPSRRKSLDFDRTKSSAYSSSKSYIREKYSEKKRRNSVGSSKDNQEYTDYSTYQHDKEFNINKTKAFFLKNSASKGKNSKEDLTSNNIENKIPDDNNSPIKDGDDVEFEMKEREVPKRRNSTGERQGPGKMSPRRNSLGSEGKSNMSTFKEHKCIRTVISEEDKPKDEKKTQRSSRDPRTERRIRNKDRPSIEIYRPGMGKFSKQRLGREKGLGSSTELESPSSSPSPTPVLKHKTVSLH